VSFGILPLTTRRLGPADYGVFALVVAVTAVGSALGTLGSGYVVYTMMPSEPAARPSILTSYLTLSFGITAAWGTAVAGAWLVAGDQLGTLGDVSGGDLALALIAMALTPTWIVAIDVLTLDQRAAAYTVCTLAQLAASTTATLVALFAFDAGRHALFIGVAAGAACGALGAAVVLRASLAAAPSADRARSLLRVGRTFVGAQVSDTGYTLLERGTLSASSGVTPLGIYTHSQRYRDATNLGVKAVARAAWPVSLDEARADSPTFPYTRRLWSGIHAAVALAGVAAAFAAEPVIAALTHDRFTAAADYVPWWFVFVLLQSMAKTDTATLYVRGTASTLARLNVGANAVAALTLVVGATRYGAGGALAAGVAQALTYDLLSYRSARRLRRLPFTDAIALAAIGLVVVATVLERTVVDTGAGRLAGLLCGTAVAAAIVHRPLLALRRSADLRRAAGSNRRAWRQA
jgi:O-antigen/teichoic acid export membrane protein